MKLTPEEEKISAELAERITKSLDKQSLPVAVFALATALGVLLAQAYKTEDETKKNVRVLADNMIRVARFWRAKEKGSKN